MYEKKKWITADTKGLVLISTYHKTAEAQLTYLKASMNPEFNGETETKYLLFNPVLISK